MKIILEKITELPDAKHPNNKEVGYFKEGEMLGEAKVGENFYIDHSFRTSVVTEIIDDHTFKTLNSVYRWREVDNSKDSKNEIEST